MYIGVTSRQTGPPIYIGGYQQSSNGPDVLQATSNTSTGTWLSDAELQFKLGPQAFKACVKEGVYTSRPLKLANGGDHPTRKEYFFVENTFEISHGVVFYRGLPL